jgi:hypothetical protein
MKGIKGHQGFVKKYSVLGDTRHMRVPESVYPQIKDILRLLQTMGEQKSLEHVHMFLDQLIEHLKSNY